MNPKPLSVVEKLRDIVRAEAKGGERVGRTWRTTGSHEFICAAIRSTPTKQSPISHRHQIQTSIPFGPTKNRVNARRQGQSDRSSSSTVTSVRSNSVW